MPQGDKRQSVRTRKGEVVNPCLGGASVLSQTLYKELTQLKEDNLDFGLLELIVLPAIYL